MQKRAAIYCRVSSKVQADGYSLETQEAKGMELATSKGWHVTQVLHEVHTGREYRQRPVLSELRELIRGRQIDIVIVIAFDRLAREMIHQAVLLDEMKHNQVELVSVTEEIDDSPLGQFMRQALGFVAAMEWEKRRERTERGMEGKVKHGFMLGFGIPLYGYQWANTGT